MKPPIIQGEVVSNLLQPLENTENCGAECGPPETIGGADRRAQ